MTDLNGTGSGRIDSLRDAIAGLGLPAILITTYENRRYFSGFSGSAGYVFVSPDRAVLVTDQRYATQAREQAPHLQVLIHGIDPLPTLREALQTCPSRIGYESKGITDFLVSTLRDEFPELEWVATTDVGLNLRAVKDEGEVQLIAASCRIADAAWRRTLGAVRPGVSERDLAVELEYNLAKAGSERPAFPTIVATGTHSALPHAEPSDLRIAAGHIVTVDFGAVLDGYHSDLTRCLVVGEPTREMTRLLGLTNTALDDAIGALDQGVSCLEVDAVPRRIFAAEGLEEFSLRGLGHGVGLQIHEYPRVVMDNDAPLVEGMVFTIEPGLYVPGVGGVRLEETVHLGPDGPVALTTSDRVTRVE